MSSLPAPRSPAPLPAHDPVHDSPVGRSFGWVTGTMLVIANMIGMGVFTSAGYQMKDLGSSTLVIWAWLLGGISSWCGALTYAELTTRIPANGGEYAILSRIYHPLVGFVAGWVTLIVGFAGPLAIFGIMFGTYLKTFYPWLDERVAGAVLIASLGVIHAAHVEIGGGFQNLVTFVKVALLVGFIVAGWWVPEGKGVLLDLSFGETVRGIFTSTFAVSFVMVSYAYSGWNAVSYVAGEMRDPARTLPRSLTLGTLIVTLLYVGLNLVFLKSSSPEELIDANRRVAQVAAFNLFAKEGETFFTGLLVFGLVSTVGSSALAGPRVYEAMGWRFRRLRFLTIRRAGGGPIVSIAVQTVLALVLISSTQFRDLVDSCGVLLSLCATIAVAGVFVLRAREGEPTTYRTWGYPATPMIFLVLQSAMMVYALLANRVVAIISLVSIVSGVVLYFVVTVGANEDASPPAPQ